MHNAATTATHAVGELAFRLVDQSLEILCNATPVEAILDTLAVDIEDPEVFDELIGRMEGYLSEALIDHDPECGALQPQAIIASVSAVVCSGCIPRADLRQAIRHARKRTQFQRDQFRADPAHWARVIALVVAAVLQHDEDPYSAIDEIDALIGR